MVNYHEDRVIGNGHEWFMTEKHQISEMLTIRQVARLLHVHTNTVRRWSNSGLIRAYRISRRGDRRYRREDIARFLAEFNVDSADQRKAGST